MSLPACNFEHFTRQIRHGTIREYARGSRSVLARAELDWGIFETVAANAGPFRSKFDVYAVVLSTTPSFGRLKLNGLQITAPESSGSSFSLFCPGDTVSGVFSADVVYDVLYIQPDYVDEVISSEVHVHGLRLASAMRVAPPLLIAALWRRIRLVLESHDDPSDVLSESCVRLLLLQLAEPQLLRVSGKTVRRRDRSLVPALRYIDANLGNPLALADIAKSGGLSTFHFCRVFRRATGLSVRQFVMERRLEKARQLLSGSDLAICGIALDCGFSSQSHFTTAFRVRYGTTPHAFRHGGSG